MNLEWMITGSLEQVTVGEAMRICRVVCADSEFIGSPMSVLEVTAGPAKGGLWCKHAAFEVTQKPGGEPMVNLKHLARFLMKCEEEGFL